jgi:hypothetical protein
MEKTLFAGLTQLDPGEALSTDNASFQSENPPKIDRLLEIGAVTHRHNAHPAQANPGSAAVPGASAIASGGHIPADTNIYVGFTLLDFDQGETTLSPIVTVSTDTPIESPDDAPTTEVDYTGGGLVPDTYYYAISLLDAEGGETPLGPTTAVEREPGYASGRVLVSGLLAPVEAASAAGWRLWRAVGGGDLFYIASGATDTFMDDGTECIDCTLGPVNPESNLTNGDNTLLVEIPSGGAMATASAFSVYLSTDPSFDSGSLAGTYPIASAGTVLTFLDLLVEDHRPPDVSTCIPGASRIDPDTELIDWHWKRPVASAAVLPLDAEEGDVRVTLDDGVPHRFIDGAWGVWDMSGGGGDVTVPIETNWGTEPLSHVPIWQSASADVLWLKGFERTVNVLVMEEPFDEASGSIGDLYDTDGFGNAIPTASGVDHNAIHYPAMTPAWAQLFDGYVERTFTITASASHFTRTGVTLGTGRTGLFAWITQAGNLEIATRTVDSDDDADFTIIATDPLPAVPANGDTYNVHFERVGNHLHATVFQSKSVIAECEADIPAPMQVDFGTDVALEPGLSDRWLDVDAWTTDVIRAVFYDRRRELYAEGVIPGGSTNLQILFDGIGDRVFNLGTQDEGVYSAGWADLSGVEASFLRNSQGRVFLSGRSVKSAGAAPVAEDVIVTLDEQARPLIEVLAAVVTGDDNGMQLGMVRIDAGGNVRWVDGTSSTPATFHPYVCFDGISYSAA